LTLDKPLQWIFEMGLLKRTPRSGWSLLGIRNPESVADHSFRCAAIGYILAHMEGADAHRVMVMTLFGDLHEARITDLHKMAQHYVDADAAEDRAFADQIEGLPAGIHGDLSGMRADYRAQESKESIIARDADILECLIQAKEYSEQGNPAAVEFTKNAGHLATDSARRLWNLAESTDVNAWWRAIGVFGR